MELIYVFGVALGLALAIGLIVRKRRGHQDQEITMEQWRATVRWPAASPPPPRRTVDTIAPITEWPQPEPPKHGVT